jgi:uncharacterized protein
VSDIFEITSGDHSVIGVLALPEGGGPFPCVVLSHGLLSSKASTKYISLSGSLLTAGMAACRFDYHGCGESGGAIAETTLSIRIKDLESVFDYIVRHPSVDGGRIGFLGSSFGGSTALVVAAKHRTVAPVALWATPYRLEKTRDNSISGLTFQRSIFDDFLRYDLLSEARKVSHAIVVHGELDEVVPCSEGKAIYAALERPKKFVAIAGADHAFTSPSHREKASELSLTWLRRFLMGQDKKR